MKKLIKSVIINSILNRDLLLWYTSVINSSRSEGQMLFN